MVRRTSQALFAAAVLALGSTAYGISFGGYSGPIKIKLSNFDVGTIYRSPDGTYVGENTINALPNQTAPQGAIPGEDGWGILLVEQITANDGSNAVLYQRGGAPTEITAIFWGIRDTYLNIQNAGTANEVQEIHGVGLHAAFFEGPQNYNNGVLGPAARNNTTNNDATNMPSYPTVTDGNLLWTVNSVPGFNANHPTDEFFTTFSPSGNLLGGLAASGGFYADLGAVPGYGVGPSNNQWVGVPNGPDITVQFTGRLTNVGAANGSPWLIASDDPILGAIAPIPLPSSVYLGALGMGVLAVRSYRRRRAEAE